MPRIFDNIDQTLLPELRKSLEVSQKADFCVGYFNLRGWKCIDSSIENLPFSDMPVCRLLIGMYRPPRNILQEHFSFVRRGLPVDNATITKLKKSFAADYRSQLTIGYPTNEDELGLQKLAQQIRRGALKVKLFLAHSLHAKLYLLTRDDPINPRIGYIGSSNLTFAGLSHQGELNTEILDGDACEKLFNWFEQRWNERLCIDISDELLEIIGNSWATPNLVSPYHVYLKIVYNLSHEAQSGLSKSEIPAPFRDELFEFQTNAVKIASLHLEQRGGVVIGDVVGLGKTIMASALLKIREKKEGRSLIICPKNLVDMWENYVEVYSLHAKVVSISQVENTLPTLQRYRTVLIDESQNLRNRQGKRYRTIEKYIKDNDSKCILLSATPFNKTYIDLSSQLRLFIEDNEDIGIRPEAIIRKSNGEAEFQRRHQCSLRSILAFEKSDDKDDWRDLMRLFMVRRTRGFIIENYASVCEDSKRKYVSVKGEKWYFPKRIPKTVSFSANESDKNDPYGQLYSSDVVTAISDLHLPRYGLGKYLRYEYDKQIVTEDEKQVISGLNRAGKRLVGFCRTNLFKRLESSGPAFLLSIRHHIARNLMFIVAMEKNCPLPIGSFDIEMESEADEIEESDRITYSDEGVQYENSKSEFESHFDLSSMRKFAEEQYQDYFENKRNRFRWVKTHFFNKELKRHLKSDVEQLVRILDKCDSWDETLDNKLGALEKLLVKRHSGEKVLIFTQFADTARYLEQALKNRKIDRVAAVTGSNVNPTLLAWRFSPRSNNKTQDIERSEELDVLISTDVLSEGQNLQDCSVVINFDLPWAIVRLIQRAGRVDRIGQAAKDIYCYSFLPADGVEKLIRLRSRIRTRLNQNKEVIGSDEAFFEDDNEPNPLQNLYNEKEGSLDGDEEGEVDLSSYAYQEWTNATKNNPRLRSLIESMPDVAYSTKAIDSTSPIAEGAIVYIRTRDNYDALIRLNSDGETVTQSPLEILREAKCNKLEKSVPRSDWHHNAVQKGLARLWNQEQDTFGSLGRPSGIRYRLYTRLKQFSEELHKSRDLLISEDYLNQIDLALGDIYRFPLSHSAKNVVAHIIRDDKDDLENLGKIVIELRNNDELTIYPNEPQPQESTFQIICSMGLRKQL